MNRREKYTRHNIIVQKIEKTSLNDPLCLLNWCNNSPSVARTTFHGPNITKTCLYNFDPLKPHFYIVKLGFTGVYIILLFLLKTVPTIYVLSRNMKNIRILLSEKLPIFGGKIFSVFE